MNILFLTQVLPYPLTSGARVRAYYMLRYLAQKHQVTLVSFIRQDDAEEELDHLRQYCHTIHTVLLKRTFFKNITSFLESLITGVPAIVIRDRNGKISKLLKKLAQSSRFDVVHADQTSMAIYASIVMDQVKPAIRPRCLLDQHNALYNVVNRQANYESGFWKLLWRRETRLLRSYERRLCEIFDQIITVTHEDKTLLLELFPSNEKHVIEDKLWPIPICIDPGDGPVPIAEAGRTQIVHIGTMFWPPNAEAVLWFSNEVLPMIIEKVPEVMFIVAGKDPPKGVQALTNNPRLRGHIEVSGYIRDPRDLISTSSVFVVPLRAGGGMRVKILDAWSWGIPVVSTSIGAEGIKIEPGSNLLIADDAVMFAEQVIRIIEDEELAGRLRKNGRSWVKQHYDWRKTYRQVNQVYQRLDSSRLADDHLVNKNITNPGAQ